MPVRAISFPQLHLVPRSRDLELSLQTCLTLDLPENHSEVQSYSDLLEAVQDEQLWIARQGSSYLTITLTNNAQPVSALERIMVEEWIKQHEIWSRLGVRLVLPEGQYTASTIQFSLQHPDLSSALTSPVEAFEAEFREISCEINIRRPSQKKQNDQKRGKKRNIRKGANEDAVYEPSQRIDNQSISLTKENIYEALETEDQKLIDAFLEGWVPPPKKRKGAAGEQVDHVEDARGPLEGAIEVLLFGGSKRVNGIKVLEGANILGLAHLLPGVFHMPHLKAISERASLLPVIATSLARMTNAESPNLRRKTKDFKYGMPLLDMEVSESEKVIRGIEKASWSTLLKNTKVAALNPKSTTRQVQQPATPIGNTPAKERAPTLILGKMFTSQVSPESQRSTLERWESTVQRAIPPGHGTPSLSHETLLGTPLVSSQERREPTMQLFYDTSPAVNATPVMADPFSTPIPNHDRFLIGDSTSNAPLSGHPGLWGPSSRTNTSSFPRPPRIGSLGSSPSEPQYQSYIPQTSQDQNFQPMLSQDGSISFEPSQNAMVMPADPTIFGSYENLMGDDFLWNMEL